jgi:streptomycin 6-kinase
MSAMAVASAVPPALARNAVGVWGDDGRRWLADLPRIIDEALHRWSLRVEQPLPMSFHWVAAVTRDDGTPAVLKLAVPQSDHQPAEAAALRAYAGRGAVRLQSYDPDLGALLLHRASPGRMLRHLVPERDEDATAVVGAVMRELHAARVPDAGVPPLTGARSSFARYLSEHPGDAPLPRLLVSRALSLFDDLVASASTSVLLHGDLHHDNVLSDVTAPSGWVAIDPHGWVGDPGFDVGPLLYNPDPSQRSDGLLRLVPGRIDQLAELLGLARERVVAWGFVMGVLSEVWSTEDSAEYSPDRALEVALLLEPQVG